MHAAVTDSQATFLRTLPVNVAALHPGRPSLSGSSLPWRSFFFDGARLMVCGRESRSINLAHVVSTRVPFGSVSVRHRVTVIAVLISHPSGCVSPSIAPRTPAVYRLEVGTS